MKRLSISLATFLLLACGYTYPDEAQADRATSQEFNLYWYAGMAEITSYELSQARYGQMHPGESVLVFVTEDFLVNSQVKRESDTKEEAVSVLKLNRIDRFTTGIYDYSMMLSVFTPIERGRHPYTLKTSFSSQDWCGHSWMQLNHRESGYEATVRSYFESEGDVEEMIGEVLLEDELWTLARLDPRKLPVGKMSILPSSSHSRMNHRALAPEEATGQLVIEVDDKDGEQFVYTLTYESGRSLRLFIQTSFPHRIYGWNEKVKSGYGPGAKWLSTTAKMKASTKSAYWGKNSPDDRPLRKQLRLD